MEGLYDLFHSMCDFVDNFIILKTGTQLHVTYVVKIYDLVDKDLDYDEDYYNKFLANLQSLVISECQATETPKTVIVVGKKLMKETSIYETKITLTPTETIYKHFKSK